jgi:hypothetical protein
MALTKKIAYAGNSLLSTLNGRIRFDEGRGRISIENGDNIEVTRLDTLGLTTIEAATGHYKNRVGVAGDDARTIIATAKPGKDLRDLIGG